MAVRGTLAVLVAVLFLPGGWTASAFAQLTTGTIAGSVRDDQGAADPGRAGHARQRDQGQPQRIHDRRARATTSSPTSRPTPTPSRSCSPVSRRRSAPASTVSPGDRVVGAGAGARARASSRKSCRSRRKSPLVQASSGERSFTVDTDAVQNLPIQGRSFTQLAALAPGVTGTTRIGDRSSTGGGDTNVQMDGVSTMDTGSNRAIIDLNVESIAEVKVLVSNYQAEYGRSSGLQITAVTKSGTNRFRGSLYDVERNSDWNANSRTQHPQRRSEDGAAAARVGLFDRRSGRQAGRQQQAVLLLHAGVRAAHRRQRRHPVPRADRARAAGRLLAVDSTTTATRIRTSRIRRSRARVRRPIRPAVTPTAACSAASRPRRSIRPV